MTQEEKVGKDSVSVSGDNVVINQYQPSKDPEKKKWVIPVVTTLVGVIATIVVAWYQLKTGEEQALQAALERERSVVQNVVKIVEEHVINNNSVDIPRLARLIDLRTREEKLPNKISVLQIIQKAEFNIINSSYLEFEKKNEYKKVFDEIYSNMSFDGLDGYSGVHENVANELAKSIRSGDHETAITALNSLLDLFNQDIQAASERKVSPLSTINKLFDSNFLFILAGVQIAAMVMLTVFRQLYRRKREIEFLKRHEMEKFYRSKMFDDD